MNAVIVTQKMLEDGMIIFLLNNCPIDQLEDCMVDIVSRYRASAICGVDAKNYIKENKMQHIRRYLKINENIASGIS